jgi:elongator complex protein 1
MGQEDTTNVQLLVTETNAANDEPQAWSKTAPLIATSTYQGEGGVEGYGQDSMGKLYRLLENGNEELPIQFPTQLPWFEVTKHDEFETAFGLSRNGHLYANSRVLAKNCTSFILTPSHLIFTTSNHFVKFVHLSLDVEGKTFCNPISS